MDTINSFIFETKSELNSAYNKGQLTEGSKIFVKQTGKIFTINNGELVESNSGDINFKMSNYEINKMIYAQMPPKSKEALEEYVHLFKTAPGHRSMLLCRELNYYTIFEYDKNEPEFPNEGSAVLTCALDLGEIVDVNKVEDNDAIEIWIKLPNGEAVVAYHFNCDNIFVKWGM